MCLLITFAFGVLLLLNSCSHNIRYVPTPCCVCVSNPVPKGIFILFCRRTFKQEVLHAEFKNRGQQGVHSSAANEDSCAGSSNCTTRSRCLQSQDQTIQPGPKATNGPTRELVHYARSHCRRTGANSGFFLILVLSQVRNALLGTRFQSPPTQSHDRPCHHRSNSGKDSKSLLRLHCPQETGVRNLGSMTPTVGT